VTSKCVNRHLLSYFFVLVRYVFFLCDYSHCVCQCLYLYVKCKNRMVLVCVRQLERRMTHECERFTNIFYYINKAQHENPFFSRVLEDIENEVTVIIRPMSDCLFFHFFFLHSREPIVLIMMMLPSGYICVWKAKLTRNCVNKIISENNKRKIIPQSTEK
jgi:hypothetical protein